jgi:hypothetical protein
VNSTGNVTRVRGSDAAPLAQGSILTDAEIEAIRPGSTRPWNPAASARYLTGVQDAWHAVDCRAAQAAVSRAAAAGPPPVSPAVCGELVRVAARYGAYERTNSAVRGGPCRYCAWTVAIATGSTGRELALITPGRRDAEAIARAGADPMLAVLICQAILAAESGEDAEYGLDHPATIQLLAHATRHRPVLLVPEDCAEDPCSCEHQPAGADDDWHCGYPGATAACGTCTLHAGGWAGSWEGTPMAECTVPAPCSVQITLAARYGLTCRQQWPGSEPPGTDSHKHI